MADQNLEAAPAAVPASVRSPDLGPDLGPGNPAAAGGAASGLMAAELPSGIPPVEPQGTRSRLLDIARIDSDNAARLVQSRADFARRGEILHKAVPDKYLELVGALRTAVRSYNDALRQLPENPIPYCQWYESPNVILREPLLGDGMRVRLTRVHSHFELVLRFVNRSMKPDVPLIEGYGDFGRDMVKRRVLMRIEGWVERGEVQYWYNLDFKRQQVPLHEVPDRIVMAVVASDYTHLSRDYSNESEPFDSESEADGA